MLKSCKHCGRVHDMKYECGMKPTKKYKQPTPENNITLFRWSKAWKQKRAEIVERDGYCCVVCSHNLYGTTDQYNTEGLEVHHITPLRKDYEKRLDNNNLITLCSYHHHMAEQGDIPKGQLKNFLRKNT